MFPTSRILRSCGN